MRRAIVSFHFGLPSRALLECVRATGALVLASATTVAEAEWLVANGCDGMIAQGLEAGWSRGMVPGRAPPFPIAANALAPLRARAEAARRFDYSPMWAGQAAPLARAVDARALTQALGAAALAALEER